MIIYSRLHPVINDHEKTLETGKNIKNAYRHILGTCRGQQKVAELLKINKS